MTSFLRQLMAGATVAFAIAGAGARTAPPDSDAVRVDSLAAPVDTTAIAPAPAPVAGRPDPLALVVALEDKRRKAMVAADVKTLTGLIAPDATYVHSTGIMQTREELLRLLANKTIVYKSFDMEKTAYRVYGTTIVGTGVQRITVMAGGKTREIHSRYTVTYAERDGVETLIAYQSTPLPEMTTSPRK